MKLKTINISLFFWIFVIISSIGILSCKSKNVDYIIYYNKVNKIDSIYRIANKPDRAIRKYKRLFKKYEPKNQERIEEYATYITLSTKHHKNFGGQKSLYKLIPLIAPYNQKYKDFFNLYSKYGIDSGKVKQEIVQWKNNLNKTLIDSFTVAMIRDQEGRPFDSVVVKRNIEKNTELFVWTFKNYGFPSLQKIGQMGNNNIFIAMPTLVSHIADSEKHFGYFKTNLLKYVKSGEYSPQNYAMIIDSYNLAHKEGTYYGLGKTFESTIDSIQINKNRKSIGLPSLKHSDKIRKDFISQIKKK